MSDQVQVPTLPACDVCKIDGATMITRPAAYDGKTTFGPWAYMCEDHWKSHGVGRLGTGFGQRLILADGGE